MNESFEGWAYRNGLLRQVNTLEQRKLVECDQRPSGDRLYRLTEKGRLHVLGGRDPEAKWLRRWDGRWRLVLFDVPVEQDVQRVRLRRYLHANGFGCLQGSVWVTPDPVAGEREILAGGKVNVNSLLLLEARPCAGESDAEIVAGAWDFVAINRNYTEHLKVLDDMPTESLRDEASAQRLNKWANLERVAWLTAVEIDPLLPERLLPAGYGGQRAWKRRIEVLRRAGERLRKFRG